MTRQRSMIEEVARLPQAHITGVFFRHAAPNRDPFVGGFGGRWGATFPVIYLGRPTDSCVEEAYRHLVDDAGVPPHLVKPRTLYTVKVEISNVLDLRAGEAQRTVGLTTGRLESAVGDYETCQRVAAAAHQLELHGVIAPAATGLGETLSIFRERAGLDELPIVTGSSYWQTLPRRPGTQSAHMRIVPD